LISGRWVSGNHRRAVWWRGLPSANCSRHNWIWTRWCAPTSLTY